MVRLSNSLLGLLNMVTFLLSIPILGGGVWLAYKANTECEKFMDKQIIALGMFLMVISLAGLIGACCHVSWLLWLYLFVMFFIIVIIFCFTIFAFVVTNKGAGQVLSGRGYKEYRLGDYSHWLQKRVNKTKNWNKIKSCIIDSKLCSQFNTTFTDHSCNFYSNLLNPLQSGCCKPPNGCNFRYVGPTVWNKTAATLNSSSATNPDCSAWNNDPNILCYDCQSCKAGMLDIIKSDWKKVAIVNTVFLVFLIVVYTIGCCAFRNNRQHNHDRRFKGFSS